jgi:membrane-associated phospholipid phosphatase
MVFWTAINTVEGLELNYVCFPIQEYGLPSTHTMNSLCMNFYAAHYLHVSGLVSDSAAGSTRIFLTVCMPSASSPSTLHSHALLLPVLLYAMSALWVCWIAASRIYLGMHTPVDIFAGAVAGLTTVTCFIAIQSENATVCC